MNLIRKTYDTTEVQITSFQSSKGITEYHIFFQQTNCLEDFHTQLQHIQDVYAHSVEELPGNPVAIFRRYFLSDVTNQTDELMERERLSPYCALSIVQQAPMNGTKIALWAWLQTGVQTQVLPNGLFEARHGAYGQLLGANQCNRAANSEYQTRLIFRDYILQLTEANCTLAANCLYFILCFGKVQQNLCIAEEDIVHVGGSTFISLMCFWPEFGYGITQYIDMSGSFVTSCFFSIG